MNRRELINNLRKKQNEGKRMKKTIPTIFITDDSKENTSLMVKRNVNTKNKRGGRFFVKVIKKNQIIMFVSALCLVGVGYLAYNPMEETNFVSTTLDNSALADIGDATFVSTQQIVDDIEEAKENNKLNVDGNTVNSTNNNIVENENLVQNNKEMNNNVENITVNTNAEIKEEDYFINSRLDRDKMYSQMLESYQKILDNVNVSAEQKAIATQEISKINNQKNSIMIAENLIKNKGFEEVVIFINLDSISVIVKADELEKEEIAQIQNIVTRELGTEIENVHISTR